MVHVMCQALVFDHPHGNVWILQMGFVEVKDDLISLFTIEYLFHVVDFTISHFKRCFTLSQGTQVIAVTSYELYVLELIDAKQIPVRLSLKYVKFALIFSGFESVVTCPQLTKNSAKITRYFMLKILLI